MSRATCRRRIGNGIASPRGVRESPSVPAREDVLERRLDVRAEVEPPGEPLRHLAHRRERVTGPRAGVGDRVLDQRGADLRRAAGPDVGLVEREHLRRVGRVDQEERGSVLDVVAVQLRRLVAVRRAPGGVEERDVVRVRELLRRCSGELAETDREHGGAQRVLERLPGAEVGRERQGTDHLGGADRPLARRQRRCDRSGILGRHVGILLRLRLIGVGNFRRVSGVLSGNSQTPTKGSSCSARRLIGTIAALVVIAVGLRVHGRGIGAVRQPPYAFLVVPRGAAGRW